MLDATNPYAPPAALVPSLAFRTYDRRPGAFASLESARFLYRKIAVKAPLEATIEYRGYECWDRILVDGVTRARKISWIWFAPLFEFELPCEPIPARVRVDVRIGPWLTFRWLRLAIDGLTVYEEGACPKFQDAGQPAATPIGEVNCRLNESTCSTSISPSWSQRR